MKHPILPTILTVIDIEYDEEQENIMTWTCGDMSGGQTKKPESLVYIFVS